MGTPGACPVADPGGRCSFDCTKGEKKMKKTRTAKSISQPGEIVKSFL